MSVANLHHVSLRVQDPERSRRFYEEVLQLSFMEVGEETAGIWRGHPKEGTMLATQAGDTFVILVPPLGGTPPTTASAGTGSAWTTSRSAWTTERRSTPWSTACEPRGSTRPASGSTRC